jgi:hypothetical protein
MFHVRHDAIQLCAAILSTSSSIDGCLCAGTNRFEEAIAAAKAYDKAAVYLYGASAITNFGLEACLAGK